MHKITANIKKSFLKCNKFSKFANNATASVMRDLLIAATLLCLTAATAAGTETLPASDSKILYEGRTVTKDGSVSFDWSNTIIRINFKGTRLEMNCTATARCYFNYWLDKPQSHVQDGVIVMEGGSTVTLAEHLADGNHTLILQKRNEGEYGCVTVRDFTTDGRIIRAADPHARHIEFIGDSYTCGYGTEGADRNQPFRAEEENCNLAYASIIGRFFDAGVRTICHSGRGVVRNYGDAVPEETMVAKYAQVFDDMDKTQKWHAGRDGFMPDIVVIYLGTNDFSTGKQPSLQEWCTGYEKLLQMIRENYGAKVPVLCVASNADVLLGTYVRTAVERTPAQNVHWTSIQAGVHNHEGDLGSSWHPNYSGQRKVACCMIPYISTLTGWDMPVKTIE